MKTPVVDYRQFRLSKLNDPQFSHLNFLSGWIGYFALYALTEQLIPAERCHIVHSRLDDAIPFCELFAIPYVFWYLLILLSLLYFALYSPDSFKKLMTFIIVTYLAATAIYIILPTRQELRPAAFPRDNFLSRIMGVIYSVDTNTGVCPSLHVAYSIGIASVWLKTPGISKGWKAFVVNCAILISLSTAFVKQHSVLDIFAALPVCLMAEGVTFGKSYWCKRLQAKRT